MLVDEMANKVDLPLAEFAFLLVQCDMPLFQMLHQSLVMFSLVLAMDKDVINQVNYALQSHQYHFHSLLEDFWCTQNPEREFIEVIPSFWHEESGILEVLRSGNGPSMLKSLQSLQENTHFSTSQAAPDTRRVMGKWSMPSRQ